MGKISVDNFVKMYTVNSKAKDKTFEEFIKKHIVVDYVDFLTKTVICDGIIKSTCHIKDGEREVIKINSSGKYLLFIMKLIDLYTDIEIDFKDGKYVEQYDKLNKVGAIIVLTEAIPVAEYAEFNMVLNMKLSDFESNEYSLTALLYNTKQSLSLTSEAITEALKSPEVKEIIKEFKEVE